MNKITCNICMDLIPLVKDEVASNDSVYAVKKHIDECEKCRELFNEYKSNTEKIRELNDMNIITKLKRQLILIATILVVAGSFLGVFLSESEGMFYNILILPIIGILSYYVFRSKSYKVPIGMFIFVYIYHLIKYTVDGLGESLGIISLLIAPTTWALLYSALCGVGTLIGFLLLIAFRKEEK